MNSITHVFLRPKDSIVCHPGIGSEVDLTIRSDREPGRLTLTGSMADLRRLHVVIGACLSLFDAFGAALHRPSDGPSKCQWCGNLELVTSASVPGHSWCPDCGAHARSGHDEPDGSTDYVDIVPASAALDAGDLWESMALDAHPDADPIVGRRNCPGIVP